MNTLNTASLNFIEYALSFSPSASLPFFIERTEVEIPEEAAKESDGDMLRRGALSELQFGWSQKPDREDASRYSGEGTCYW